MRSEEVNGAKRLNVERMVACEAAIGRNIARSSGEYGVCLCRATPSITVSFNGLTCSKTACALTFFVDGCNRLGQISKQSSTLLIKLTPLRDRIRILIRSRCAAQAIQAFPQAFFPI